MKDQHQHIEYYIFLGIGILGSILALGMFITIFYLVFYNKIDNTIKYQKVQQEEKQE